MAPITRSQTNDPPSRPVASMFREPSPEEPPVYRIDLSLPPRERYREICRDYKPELLALSSLYADVLAPFPNVLKYAAKLLLRRVHSSEETEEIRGIAEETGLERHLVLAYNTFLDLFSGCISGGVRVSDAGGDGNGGGIVHFRGLDWEMEPLRDLIICVEYVRGGEVVARAVTYAGYIGTLTGVRNGLSISLNYRPRLNSPFPKFSHRFHQLSLLLGFRSSIASHLRRILLSPGPAPTLQAIAQSLPRMATSPCYLTFCSPTSVLLIEKDLKSATLEVSDEFLAVTNHDKKMEDWDTTQWEDALKDEGLPDLGGVRDMVKDSVERKECVAEKWRRSRRTQLRVTDVREWLEIRPVTNECTHFSCVMDPGVDGGGLAWVRAYSEVQYNMEGSET